MFAVHLNGKGDGCDYCIACNEKLVMLPEHIDSFEAANEYIMTSDDEGSVSYYGRDRIELASIIEINNINRINVE